MSERWSTIVVAILEGAIGVLCFREGWWMLGAIYAACGLMTLHAARGLR